MLKLFLLLALKVATPGEMACLGYALDSILPMDLYVAGIQNEGASIMAVEGDVVYLNGPKVTSLRVGEKSQVVRPEGRIRDPLTGVELGIYHRRLGTIQVERIDGEIATARVLLSCVGISKGDLVIPDTPRSIVEFSGDMSRKTTAIPQYGFASSIVLGQNDARELAAGQFCFIAAGARDGIRPGDQFTVVRPHPKYNPGERSIEDKISDASYASARSWGYLLRQSALLHNRTLPLQILGDIVVVDIGDKMSAAKVVNSLTEIHIGDLVVRR